jgi:hypothetical protein
MSNATEARPTRMRATITAPMAISPRARLEGVIVVPFGWEHVGHTFEEGKYLRLML